MIKVILKLYDFKLIYLKMIMSKRNHNHRTQQCWGTHTLTITRRIRLWLIQKWFINGTLATAGIISSLFYF